MVKKWHVRVSSVGECIVFISDMQLPFVLVDLVSCLSHCLYSVQIFCIPHVAWMPFEVTITSNDCSCPQAFMVCTQQITKPTHVNACMQYAGYPEPSLYSYGKAKRQAASAGLGGSKCNSGGSLHQICTQSRLEGRSMTST